MYIRFWHSGQLVRVYLKRAGLRQGKTTAELGLISHIVGAIFTRPDVVACLGCSPDTVSLLNNCKFLHHGVQSPFRFDCLSVKDLMNKKSYSVFDRVDFFSVLQYLIVSLGGCISQEWTLTTPELTKVCKVCLVRAFIVSGLVLSRLVSLGHQVMQVGSCCSTNFMPRDVIKLGLNLCLPFFQYIPTRNACGC